MQKKTASEKVVPRLQKTSPNTKGKKCESNSAKPEIQIRAHYVKIKLLEWVTLSLVFLVGITLRIIEVLNKNYLFGYDQGRDYLKAYDIVANHTITLIGSEVGSGFAVVGGLFQGPFYYYTIAVTYILFNGDPYGALLLMFVFGIATLFLTYILFKRFYGKWGSILVTFLVAVSSRIVDQSRFQWNAHLTSVFVVLSLYFTLRITDRPSLYLPLSLFFAGIIYNFEIALSIPMVITIFIYAVISLKNKNTKAYLFGFIATVLSYLPFIIFEIRHRLAINGFIQYFSKSKDQSQIDFGFIAREHLSDFWNNAQVTFKLDNEYFTIAVFVLLFIFSLYYVIRTKDSFLRKLVLLSFLLILVNFIIFLFLKSTVWNYYITELHFIYIFLFSYIFLTAVKRRNIILCSIFGLLVGVIMVNSVRTIIKDFKYDYYDYGGVHKIKAKTDALDYIYNDAQGKPFGLFVFVPSIYTDHYDYVAMWYGKSKYGYIPNSRKDSLFYLIIETDKYQPWRQEGWLETVIKTGEIVETKTLPSGLTVQKRYGENVK